MNVRQLSHFLAVLEHGSILRASHQLNLSQPALSKSIATLEDHYGVPLFKRLPRGVRPTTFALTLDRHARRILADLETTHRVLATLASGSTGTIAFGTGSSFVTILAEAIADFTAESPNVDFTVVTDHANHLRDALVGNRIDFFVGMCNRLMGDKAFDIEPVFVDRFVGVCSNDHPFAHRRVSFEDVRGAGWIVPELEEAGRAALEAYFVDRAGTMPRFRIVTNSDVIVRRFVATGGMLTVLPEANTGSEQFAQFARFDLEGFLFKRQVGIVRRANVDFSPLLDRFVASVRERLHQMAVTTW
jgi:DNA-binding transcriptional LysR family regulator